MTKVDRYVRVYNKQTEDLIEETYIDVVEDSVEFEVLKALFDVEDSNPMYDCYPIITEEQQRYLALNFDLPLDTFDDDSKEYFLEADAVS